MTKTGTKRPKNFKARILVIPDKGEFFLLNRDLPEALGYHTSTTNDPILEYLPSGLFPPSGNMKGSSF